MLSEYETLPFETIQQQGWSHYCQEKKAVIKFKDPIVLCSLGLPNRTDSMPYSVGLYVYLFICSIIYR